MTGNRQTVRKNQVRRRCRFAQIPHGMNAAIGKRAALCRKLNPAGTGGARLVSLCDTLKPALAHFRHRCQK